MALAAGILMVVRVGNVKCRQLRRAFDPGDAYQERLIAVNHGNLTGNYTVLRDLGSDRFRQQNDAARLAAVFAEPARPAFRFESDFAY